ncbi:MAG: YesL family protein [Oscillibacter sp.]|nr:YesL family protein [Oscillibacter sp.]
MFFRKDYAKPGPGIDPDEPEKTGFARFVEILTLECVTLVKLNLLVLLCCVPVVTLPPALYAMNQVVRKMMLDEPVTCFLDFRRAFRRFWKRGWAAFALTALPLGMSALGVVFYVPRALENPLIMGPVAVCMLVLLLTLLASPCLYGVLSTGRGVKESLRMALLLGVGKPLRPAVAALCVYGITLGAVLAFPISLIYFLLIGFSAPCFLGNFFLRTLLRDYCPPVEP